jgi:hypothetical protein
MNLPAPWLVLLQLIATARQADPADLATLDEAGWAQLGALAALHRLEPLLHDRQRDNPAIPLALAMQWQQAHRQAAMIALVQQADLVDCVALLEAHGFRPVALKGAFLARHAYPAMALRPMRDLDLLLPPDQVLAAFAVLQEAGYRLFSEPTAPLEDLVRLELHMPPMAMLRGSVLELHARISELDGKLEYATPAGNEELLLTRAITLDGLRYPCPQDMLAHLIVHAVYGHRLDCGPVVLSDVYFLATTHAIDWPAFWQTAKIGGWASGARLVIELVRRFHGAESIPVAAGEPAAPAERLIEVACKLLLQDYTAKKPARFLASIMTGDFATVFKRISGRVTAVGEETLQIDRSRQGGRLGWALGQASEMWGNLTDPAIRQQARQLAQFKRWLQL